MRREAPKIGDYITGGPCGAVTKIAGEVVVGRPPRPAWDPASSLGEIGERIAKAEALLAEISAAAVRRQ
jgi:hypothetical protein